MSQFDAEIVHFPDDFAKKCKSGYPLTQLLYFMDFKQMLQYYGLGYFESLI